MPSVKGSPKPFVVVSILIFSDETQALSTNRLISLPLICHEANFSKKFGANFPVKSLLREISQVCIVRQLELIPVVRQRVFTQTGRIPVARGSIVGDGNKRLSHTGGTRIRSNAQKQYRRIADRRLRLGCEESSPHAG